MNIILLFGLMLGLVGCLKTREDVKDLEQRQSMQQQVVSLQRVHADTASHFSDVEEQLRSMAGRIDSIDEKTRHSNQGLESQIKTSQTQSAEHSEKIALLQEGLSKLEAQILGLTAEIGALRAEKQAEETKKTIKKDIFESAQDSFEKKDWRKAILNFQKYRDNNPNGSKFAESTYKIGVSFQELEMNDEAKTFYEEVVSKFPKADEAKKAKSRLKSLKK